MSSPIFLRIRVKGLSPALLDNFVESEALKFSKEKSLENASKTGGSPDHFQSFFCSREEIFTARDADEIRFGVVGDLEGMGLWGRSSPLILTREDLHNGDGVPKKSEKEVYSAVLSLTEGALDKYLSFYNDFNRDQSLPAPHQDREHHNHNHNHNTHFHMKNGKLSSDSTIPFCCRLVLAKTDLVRAPPPTVRVARGASIIAVDNNKSNPYTMWLSKASSRSFNSNDVNSVEGENRDVQEWVAELDLDEDKSTPHFTSTREQFLLLHLLQKESSSSVENHTSGMKPEVPPSSSVTTNPGLKPDIRPGPLISLTFYSNDPRRMFDREVWWKELPQKTKETIQLVDGVLASNIKSTKEGEGAEKDAQSEKEKTTVPADSSTIPKLGATKDGLPQYITHTFEVTNVCPVRMEGSLWSPNQLPIPAPMKKRQDEKKQKRDNKYRQHKDPNSIELSTSSFNSDISSSISVLSYADSDEAKKDEAIRGWCVRPLQSIGPIRDSGLNPNSTTQTWNAIVNVCSLAHHAIQVEVEVPVQARTAHSSGECPLAYRTELEQCNRNTDTGKSSSFRGTQVASNLRFVKGEGVITSSMIRQHTSGLLQVPIRCDVPASYGIGSSPLWCVLYIQYLVVFPYNHPSNDLRVVRSVESHNRLQIGTLIGHRGLGKTYTRSRAKGQTAKLAENSIEALNAAHRRGCEMVEFDVMLTLDRVPVIFHDPMLKLQAREKKLPIRNPGRMIEPIAERVSKGTEDASESNSRQEVSASFLTMLAPSNSSVPPVATRLHEFYMQTNYRFLSIPVAVHHLTKRQLDSVITESFDFGQAPQMLKMLMLRHWDQILRIYRNRMRIKAKKKLSMRIMPGEEFRGCSTIGPNDVFTNSPTRLISIPGLPSAAHSPSVPQVDPNEPLTHTGLMTHDSHGSGMDMNDDHPAPHSTVFGLTPAIQYYTDRLKRDRLLHESREDITNYIPTLEELFLYTPPTLRLDLEVKYPFQPQWDANLFLQTDAFEINEIVDIILKVVFAYADEGREIAFSSFEPDVCVALAMKQSRYDVVFLCDTEEREDLKDYRCFGVEGAVQFASLHGLSGISICASTLCRADQKSIPHTNVITTLKRLHAMHSDHVPTISSLGSFITDEEKQRWSSFQEEHGKRIVDAAHRRRLKLWTWGDSNSDVHFAYVQAERMLVDAVITDNVPMWSNEAPGAETVDT